MAGNNTTMATPTQDVYELTTAEFCELYANEIQSDVAVIMLIPAAIVLIILAFIQKRKSLRLSCWWGRPAFFYPVNFVDEVGRRWAFAACFATMAQYISRFFDGILFWNPGYWQDPDWMLKFGWVKTLILLGNVLHLGIIFYPLFACLSLRRRLPANILGLMYLTVWVYFDIKFYVDCGLVRDRETGDIGIESILRLAIMVPIFIAELAVGICFLVDLGLNSYKYYMERTGQVKESKDNGKEDLSLQYIEFLLTHKPTKPETRKEKIKNLCRYTRIDGFKYPPRIVCTMVVAALALYLTATTVGVQLDAIFALLDQLLSYLAEGQLLEATLGLDAGMVFRIPTYFNAARWSFIIANVVASTLHVVFMIHMVICYRSHVLKIMKGDRTWHHTMNDSPASILVAGMRYSGYQIAYIVWGYIIMFIILTIVAIGLSFFIIIPLMYGERPWVVDKIIIALPPVVISMMLFYGQVFLAKFAFLQDRGAYLALNNRRVYHCVSFFLFFFNVVVGLVAVLKRTLLSLVFGLTIISRLDRCLLMRGFERFDSGFKSYLGMLEVDVHHNHPILKGFVRILQNEVEDSKAHAGDAKEMVPCKRRIHKRIRNKWWKLITLVNNPTLLLDRLSAQIKEKNSEKNGTIGDHVVDTIADAGTVIVAGGLLGDGSKLSEVITTTEF